MIPTSIRRFSRSKEPVEEAVIEEPAVVPEPEPEAPKKRRGRPKKVVNEVVNEVVEPEFEVDDSFLDELRQENEEVPPTPPASPKPVSPKPLLKPTKRKTKVSDYFDYNMPDIQASFFSDQGSKILGKEKRELLVRIANYKRLFKAELKDFKVKRDASVDELKEYLDEMDVICSLGSLENFILTGILQSIMVLEGVSANTDKYDISGTADLLKQNPQFISLSKQIMLKYGSILKTPPELQMVLLMISTMYLQMANNRKKKAGQITQWLDAPANQN